MVKKYVRAAYNIARGTANRLSVIGLERAEVVVGGIERRIDDLHPGVKVIATLLPGTIPLYMGIKGTRILVGYVREQEWFSSEVWSSEIRLPGKDDLKGRIDYGSHGSE